MIKLQKAVFVTLFMAVVAFVFSCEPEIEQPVPGELGALAFSSDTVLFDTLFTETRSITKRLKIYNLESGAINIEKISVAGDGPFSLYVYGEKGKIFNDIQLLGKDSLLVLVEAEINSRDEDTPFIIEDRLQVISKNDYSIPLIAWGQQAIFLKDTVLNCDTRFTAERPYVLVGATVVDSLCTLNIDPGARIYSHYNAGLYIFGSLKALGTPEDRILFTNDRLDEDYRNAPGQWRGIYFLEGTTGNNIQYTDIRNAEVGLRIGAPDEDDNFELEVGHAIIENISTAGVLSYTSDVHLYNSLIDNCGYASVAALAGGNYRIINNTLANYSYDFFREDATIILSNNVVLADNSLLVSPLKAEVYNNIIWGNLLDELIVSEAEEASLELLFSHNIIRTSSDSLAQNNIVNQNPLFVDPSKYDYHLEEGSPAVDAALIINDITLDLLGRSRSSEPDIGAYEEF